MNGVTIALLSMIVLSLPTAGMAGMIDIALQPSEKDAVLGEIFTLEIELTSPQPEHFDNLTFYLDYDRALLSLVGTSGTAHVGYIFGKYPVYSWSSDSPVTTDYQLPGLQFEALAPTDQTWVRISGGILDTEGNSHQVVMLGCDVDMTGSLNDGSVTIADVPEPAALSLLALGTLAMLRRRPASHRPH
jgi:MYXO-CTERM domain-containing protein